MRTLNCPYRATRGINCSKLRGKHRDFTGTCFARSLRGEFRVVDLQFHPTYQPGVDSAGDVGRNGVAILNRETSLEIDLLEEDGRVLDETTLFEDRQVHVRVEPHLAFE